ncbi:hypothetical protein VIGAN_06117800 [Vigna angularis var. angularis]|uniref:DUF7787 domain-containing protein n=1 Tax=Vigna angularis var. angularis TaxID=157739 RepID=A0A0S3SAX2_PHAAN|nr:uncharacterized protein LOC108339677 isoform X1 [Vigna angularis]BAT90017.1 hypothetical protein VIGAN_06117800 [Vigna angularis var. angularis]
MAQELPTAIPQSQGSSTKKRPTKNDKVWLEDYLHFLHSRQTLHLTMNQLNQVIRIHGFKKIHNAPKKLQNLSGFREQKVLVEAVESLDLVDVPRSTLRDSVSAFAAVALEDVVADLAELKWQECCVTSVERISFSEGKSVLPASSDESFRVTSQSKSMEAVRNLIPKDSRRSLKPTKMVPKRKRSKVPAPDSVASTVDSASLASC